MSSGTFWVALESNPEVINKYMQKLGIPETVQCVDLLGFDDELLAMVPGQPVALLLLFPLTNKQEDYLSKLKTEAADSDVYFIKQTVGNACGTIALIHALANCHDKIDLGKGCFSKFYESSKNVSPMERAKILESDSAMQQAHESSAVEGATAPPPPDANIDFHFVAIVQCGSKLIQLDGCKDGPLKISDLPQEAQFFKEAAKFGQKLAAIEPDNIHFTALALTLVK